MKLFHENSSKPAMNRVVSIALFALYIIYCNPSFSQDYDYDASPERKSRFFCNQKAAPGKKILRAEITSLTLQGLGYMQLSLMPSEETNWYSNSSRKNYENAFTRPPVWDKDGWFFNYLGHPLTGAIHYSLLRSQDVPAGYSFLYSTAQSLIWEYLIEASRERPSIQDLLLTSTTGSLIGECIHMSTIAMKKNKFTTFEKIVVTIINPMYVLNNGYRATNETTCWWRKKQPVR